MAFTPELNLELPANGDYEDVWDSPVNSNFTKISAVFAADGPYDAPSGSGHAHDGSSGAGPKIRHGDLTDGGSVPHTTLDTETGKVLVSSGDTIVDYLFAQLDAGAGILLTKLNPGADEKVRIEASGVTPVLGDPGDPSGEHGWKHFVPTSAPVAYTDNFNYPAGMKLVNCDYAVTSASLGGAPFDFRSSGYSARTSVDTNLGDDQAGQYAATVACHIPHGHAQRTTLSITELDYSNLEVGDSVTFTLSVHSTHQLGTMLPQRYGVLLEINLVKTGTGPDVFQVSHKVWIIPDDSTQVLLFSCNHSDPDHILGCWELGLDNNGHVYHYWRRKLVYSSQASPPTNVGPVAAYFSTLEASLLGIGDEKHGAMGFGCLYNLALEKSFDLEFRWLSVTSNSDEYYDAGACPPAPDPFGLPDIVELPPEFLLFPPGEPGENCCDTPYAKKMGEILTTDPVDGSAAVWVTGCNEMYDDASPGGVVKGYTVNTNWPGCFPCEPPAGTPVVIGPPADWPQEGTSGYVVVHGTGPLPPYIKVTSSTPGFVIVAVVWIDLWEFILKYEIIDGYAGTDVDIEIFNGYDPTSTLPVPVFITIEEKLPEIDSVTWLDDWKKTISLPTAGYQFTTTINGSGFNPTSVVTASDPAMVISSYTYISPSRIEATIEFLFPDTRGQTYDLIVTNVSQGELATTPVEVGYPAPEGYYVELAPDATVGLTKTAIVHGNFFDSSAVLSVTTPALVANFVPTWVDRYTMSAAFDIVGLAGQQIDFQVLDSGGGFVIMPVCVIDDISLPSISTVVVTPALVYEAGRGYKYTIQLTGTDFGPATYILLDNLTVLEVWNSDGDIHTISRSPTTADGEFWAPCGDITGVDVSAYKAGVGSDVSLAAFTTLAIPTLTLNPGDLVFSGGLEPGAAGTATLTPTAGFTHLTDLYANNDIIAFDEATRVVNPADIEWDYLVAADAVEGATTGIEFHNGDCDLNPQQHDQDIEYVAPAIASIEMNLYEDVLANTVRIRGTGFRAGAIVNLTGNISFVSVDNITSTQMDITVDNGVPGAASIEVENVDTKVSGATPVTILAELAPVFNSSQLDPAVEGTSTTVRIWGQNLTPPGAVYAWTGLAAPVQVLALPNYLEFTGTISAAVGNPVTVDITSTSHSYLALEVDIVEPTSGGDVVINSVSNPVPKDNSSGVEVIIYGENLDLVITVEADVDDADRQALQYVPSGPDTPVAVSIISKVPSTLVLSLDLDRGLAYSDYTFSFYDGGMVLLATAPAVIEAQPSDDAPVISKVVRATLDLAIPNTGLALWSAVIKITGSVPWLFGDVWTAAGLTITSQVFNGTTDEWTINGTNDAAGADWELTLTRPGIPGVEWAVYRIPGGVTV